MREGTTKKLLSLFLAVTFLGGTCGAPPANQGALEDFPSEPLTLTVWRPFDEADAYLAAAQNYRQLHPNVSIDYRFIEPEGYEEAVVNALASQAGPDIISIGNDRIPAFSNKLVSMPERFFGGSDITASLTSLYAPAVVNDVTFDDSVYGIPFSTDSLALYWNRDLVTKLFNEYINTGREFDQELLIRPPVDWDEVVNVTKLIVDRSGNTVNRAGIALGVSTNVPFTADIIAAMMLQRDVQMTSPDQRLATYHLASSENPNYYPGAAVLEYLKGFVDPNSSYYTWNASMPDALEAFIEGKVAMMIGDRSIARIIEQRNPQLGFRISPFPQIPNAKKIVDFAKYPIEAVTNNSDYPEVAWDFLRYISTTSSIQLYYSQSDRTGPRRNQPASTTVLQRKNVTSGTFALQVGTAQSWFKGSNAEEADEYLRQALDRVSIDGRSARESLNQAAASFTEELANP